MSMLQWPCVGVAVTDSVPQGEKESSDEWIERQGSIAGDLVVPLLVSTVVV